MRFRVHARLLAIAGACALGATLAASAPQQTTGTTPPANPQTPAPGGQRGGGRGRGSIAALTLTTTGWTDGSAIPEKYTQKGHDLSPPLTWTGAPDPTTSFVLIVHDLDAPVAPGTDDTLQWMVWNIPGATHVLPEGVPQGPEFSDGKRQISVTGPNYRGPAAPGTGPPHHYVFEIYALDTMIDVPAVGAAPAATRAAVIAAMSGHVRGHGVLTAIGRRN